MDRKRLRVSTQALLRRRNNQTNAVDFTLDDIRHNRVREFYRKQKDITRKKVYKASYNAINRLLRHRFVETSWIVTQQAYEQFKMGDHDRLMLFSMHFILKNGVQAYIDGEVDKQGVFTLLVNRKDAKIGSNMIHFITFVFDNEQMIKEPKYSHWSEEDLAVQVEQLPCIHHSILSQLAFFILQFGQFMNETEKWIDPRLLFDFINSLQ
jgi:hypothetical protein